jgi:antitoxin component HigA of HigAB toxin-antitoxin module
MRKVKDNRQALPAFIASKSEIGAILAHLTALTSDHAARLRMQGPGPMPEH